MKPNHLFLLHSEPTITTTRTTTSTITTQPLSSEILMNSLKTMLRNRQPNSSSLSSSPSSSSSSFSLSPPTTNTSSSSTARAMSNNSNPSPPPPPLPTHTTSSNTFYHHHHMHNNHNVIDTNNKVLDWNVNNNSIIHSHPNSMNDSISTSYNHHDHATISRKRQREEQGAGRGILAAKVIMANNTHERQLLCQSQRQRRVRFCTEAPRVQAPPLFETLTRDTVKELWYQPKEVSRFKRRTKSLILFGTANVLDNTTTTSTNTNNNNAYTNTNTTTNSNHQVVVEQQQQQEEEDDKSGLERFCFQRSRNKKQAIKCVLLAQQQQKGDDFVRLVSKKCTATAGDLALIQGFEDFCSAYDPLQSLLGDDDTNDNNDYTTTVHNDNNTNNTHSSNKKRINYNDYFFSDNVSSSSATTSTTLHDNDDHDHEQVRDEDHTMSFEDLQPLPLQEDNDVMLFCDDEKRSQRRRLESSVTMTLAAV